MGTNGHRGLQHENVDIVLWLCITAISCWWLRMKRTHVSTIWGKTNQKIKAQCRLSGIKQTPYLMKAASCYIYALINALHMVKRSDHQYTMDQFERPYNNKSKQCISFSVGIFYASDQPTLLLPLSITVYISYLYWYIGNILNHWAEGSIFIWTFSNSPLGQCANNKHQ